MFRFAEKQAFQKQKAALKKRRELFQSQDKIDARREELLNQRERRLQGRWSEIKNLFCIRWMSTYDQKAKAGIDVN